MEYIINGETFVGKFKRGDRVTVKGFGGICRVSGPDEMLTIFGKLHYKLIDEGYLAGDYKTICADPASEDEMTMYEGPRNEKADREWDRL